MPLNTDDVIEEANELLEKGGFISSLSCRKGDHSWTERIPPDPRVKAILIGCVYIGQSIAEEIEGINANLMRMR